MFFTDVCKKGSSPVVCVDHIQLLQPSLSLETDKIDVPCCKVEKDLEKHNDLEELTNLTIKETKGGREIQHTIPSHTCSCWNVHLTLRGGVNQCHKTLENFQLFIN
jgi:hypothetical protein